MQAWQKAYERTIDQNAPAAAILNDFQTLSSEQRIELSDQLRARLDRDNAMLPEERQRLEAILQLFSTLSLASAVESFSGRDTECEAAMLKLGDMVRSSDAYWSKTGQHLTGSIVRMEQVPEQQVPVVGSTQWAYLSSGDGPVSLTNLERVDGARTRRSTRAAGKEIPAGEAELQAVDHGAEALVRQ